MVTVDELEPCTSVVEQFETIPGLLEGSFLASGSDEISDPIEIPNLLNEQLEVEPTTPWKAVISKIVCTDDLASTATCASLVCSVSSTSFTTSPSSCFQFCIGAQPLGKVPAFPMSASGGISRRERARRRFREQDVLSRQVEIESANDMWHDGSLSNRLLSSLVESFDGELYSVPINLSAELGNYITDSTFPHVHEAVCAARVDACPPSKVTMVDMSEQVDAFISLAPVTEEPADNIQISNESLREAISYIGLLEML